jgi:hypothetical protein
VACPSARECVAADAGREITFDPTAPGDAHPVSLDPLGVTAFACASNTQCTAIDAWNRAVTFDPLHPSSGTSVAIGPGAIHDYSWNLACASTRQCTAVRADGGIEVTFDPAGDTPSSGEHEIDDYRFVLITVSCPTTSQCTAVDRDGKQVTFDPEAAGSPTPMSIDPNGGGLYAISCPSAVFCVAGDLAGNAVEGNPQAGSWSVVPLDGSNSVQSVSCSSQSRCVAVDDAGRVTVGQAAPLPVSDGRPAIAGLPRPMQTLSAHGGHWEFDPSTLTRQWQRCDQAGSSCTAIAGATGAHYRVTVADLGHTFRIEEWARNAAGTGGPALSTPTEPVYLAAAAVRTALKKILVPHGRAARIGNMLSHRGYTLSFRAPSAGRLVIVWYRMTRVNGARRRIVFATRAFVFHSPRAKNLKLPLTRRGRRLLRGARSEQLTATATFTPIAGPAISATRTFVLVR